MLRTTLRPLRFDNAESVYSLRKKLKEKNLIPDSEMVYFDEEFVDLFNYSKNADSQAALIVWKLKQLREEQAIVCNEITNPVTKDAYYKRLRKTLNKGKIKQNVDSYDLTQILLKLDIQINTPPLNSRKSKPNFSDNELAQHLLVAIDGNTYLWEDIQEASEEEIKFSNIHFLQADGKTISLRSLKRINDPTQLLHNKPFAKAILALNFEEGELLNLPPITNKFDGLPCIYPVINTKEETAEETDLENYVNHLTTKKNQDMPDFKSVPNLALQELISVNYKQQQQFVCNELQKEPSSMQALRPQIKQLETYQLSLNKVKNNLTNDLAGYKNIISAYPSFAGQNITNIKQQFNQKKQSLRSKTIWLRRLERMAAYGTMAIYALLIFSTVVGVSMGVTLALIPMLGPLAIIPGVAASVVTGLGVVIPAGVLHSIIHDKISLYINNKIQSYNEEENQFNDAVQRCEGYLNKKGITTLAPPTHATKIEEIDAQLEEVQSLKKKVGHSASAKKQINQPRNKHTIKYAGGAANSGLFSQNVLSSNNDGKMKKEQSYQGVSRKKKG